MRKIKKILPCLPSRNGTCIQYHNFMPKIVLNLLFLTCLLSCTQGSGSGGALFQLSILHSNQGTKNLAQLSGSHVPSFCYLQYHKLGAWDSGKEATQNPLSIILMHGNLHFCHDYFPISSLPPSVSFMNSVCWMAMQRWRRKRLWWVQLGVVKFKDKHHTGCSVQKVSLPREHHLLSACMTSSNKLQGKSIAYQIIPSECSIM